MALHYVVADARDKRPLSADYLIAPATQSEIEAARSEPYLLLGHVPGRAGLLVADIDRDVAAWRDAVIDSLGPPLCEVRTRRGLHLYFRCHEEVGNRSWAGGEIRCTNGYAVLWNEHAVLSALENIEDAEPVDTAAWPISKPQAATSKQSRPHRRASRTSESFRNSMIGCLGYLDCKVLSYHEWLFVGMGLHQAQQCGLLADGLALWIEFSKTDPARYVEGECASKWAGFDPDRGVTHKTIRWMAKQNGHRTRRRRKPKRDKLSKPERQEALMDYVFSQSKDQRESRHHKMRAQLNQGDMAHLLGVDVRTVRRDMRELRAEGRIRVDGIEVIRHATGGHVENWYQPVPVSTRHQRPVSLIPEDQQAAWMECVVNREEVPEGPLVRMGDQVYVMIPAHVTGGLPQLVPVDSRAPP